MDPVFSLPYSEYVVAERLRNQFTKANGYSIYIPVSRQEKGVDLALIRNTKSERKISTFQIKASRTYFGEPPKRKTTPERFKFYTWFNRFEPNPRADLFIIIGFFPLAEAMTRKKGTSTYGDCSLLFTYQEIKELLDNCRTVKGGADKMFGFGFNDLDAIVYTRGDSLRSNKDFVEFRLDKRFKIIE
jgi:hypothetical protein